MELSTGSRRTPVQRRSRDRVASVLSGAEEVLAVGWDAFSIRAVSERSGVSVPAIYQWFADKDEIAAALLEQQMAELDERIAAVLREYDGQPARELTQAMSDLHADFYRRHPSHVALWFQGRVTPQVTEWVHRHSADLATALHAFSVERGIVSADVDATVFRVLVEVFDRVHELAFRDDPQGDPVVIAHGVDLVEAYLDRLAG